MLSLRSLSSLRQNSTGKTAFIGMLAGLLKPDVVGDGKPLAAGEAPPPVPELTVSLQATKALSQVHRDGAAVADAEDQRHAGPLTVCGRRQAPRPERPGTQRSSVSPLCSVLANLRTFIWSMSHQHTSTLSSVSLHPRSSSVSFRTQRRPRLLWSTTLSWQRVLLTVLLLCTQESQESTVLLTHSSSTGHRNKFIPQRPRCHLPSRPNKLQTSHQQKRTACLAGNRTWQELISLLNQLLLFLKKETSFSLLTHKNQIKPNHQTSNKTKFQ